MANTSNLKAFLQDIANAIRNKKGTVDNIPAMNFDVEIDNIQIGVDTSDATATSTDLLLGKTAYANGEKIQGVLNNFENTEVIVPLDSATVATTGYLEVKSTPHVGNPSCYGEGAVISMSTLASDVGLVPENIVEGATILGVTGTYSSPSVLSSTVPDSALVLLHFDGDNTNAITDDTTNMPSISVYESVAKFGTNSARGGGFQIANMTGVPTYTELVSGQAELTISFWAYLNNTVGKLIFSAKQSTANNTAFAIQQDNTTALTINGSTIEIGDHLPNQWHHYGVMIKDGLLTVYFDGSKIYNGEISGSGTIPLRLRFGESDTAIVRIDEILVCNEAIYDENFIPLEVPYELPPIDTSDATATADDIALGKTAYANGEKIEGTITTVDGFDGNVGDIYAWDDFSKFSMVSKPLSKMIMNESSTFSMGCTYQDVADAIGLTSDKLVSGNTILGVEGTGGSSGSTDLEIHDCSYLFYYGSRANEISSILPYCKNVTSMKNMFASSSGITSVDLSEVTVENLTTMDSMFQRCSKLTSVNLGTFDTSKVTTMNSLFYGCSALTTLDVSMFNTSSVTNMYGVFGGCSSLASIKLWDSDTSSVTTMCYMFASCKVLKSIDVSGFNTSAVTNFMQMFLNCSTLTELDLSNFTTEQAENMTSMFSGCTSLSSLNLQNWVVPTSATTSGMFENVPVDCEITVSTQDVKDWILTIRDDFTNIVVSE